MNKENDGGVAIDSTPLLACPWCGGKPDIHKHFRDPLWQLLHRCRIMGALHIDWTDNPEMLVKRWNHRHANSVIDVTSAVGTKPTLAVGRRGDEQ